MGPGYGTKILLVPWELSRPSGVGGRLGGVAGSVVKYVIDIIIKPILLGIERFAYLVLSIGSP